MRANENPPLPEAERDETKAGRGGALLAGYRAALVLTLVLALLLIAGTLFGLLRGRGESPLFILGGGRSAGSGPAAGEPGPAARGGVGVFTGIRRLRIPVAGAGTVILSIAFPYPLEDRAFSEELAARVADFRRIAAEYFGSLDSGSLENIDEDAAKSEILRRCNALLRLGKIETLYFYDLMLIE